MEIKSIHVKNLGSLRDVIIPCDGLTVLVGKNGVGKSTTLKALRLFYNTGINLDERDFFNGDTDDEISITISYGNLTQQEKELFESYVNEDKIEIEKVFRQEENRLFENYYGNTFTNPEFNDFRVARGADLKRQYNIIKEKYDQLPDYTNKGAAEESLSGWELANKEDCEISRDNGVFFGFKRIGRYDLEQHTRLIYVPAVHEASMEAQQSSNSSINDIMNLVVMGSLVSDPEFQEIEMEAQRKYSKFIARVKDKKLGTIGTRLSTALGVYFPDTSVEIDWVTGRGVSLSPPSAFIRVTEDGYQNTIDRCGHGLQRAFILTMFQELAIMQATIEEERAEIEEAPDKVETITPNIIICIEEPELYQHPSKQRHLANTLYQLSMGGIEGVTNRIQVMYATHSPLMVDYQRFNQLRMFKKERMNAELPKETRITYASLQDTATLVEKAKNLEAGAISQAAFQQSLISLMTPWMNEGFFSDLIVLVEGIKDRALIVGQALSIGVDLESMGIAIIPCSGKFSMPEAISIFKSVNIPIYTVWDSDYDVNSGKVDRPEINENILRCYDFDVLEAVSFCTEECACVLTDLETTFQEDIGVIEYNRVLQAFLDEFGYGRGRNVMENPALVMELILRFSQDGKNSETLTGIVESIIRKFGSIN